MILQLGVKALIQNHKGEYLFIRRSKLLDTGEPKMWDIPGGRLRPDEDFTLVKALARETLEETGLQVTGTPSMAAAQDILDRKADLHVVRLTYQVTAQGEVTLSNEHDKFKWLQISKALNLKTDPYLMAVLQNLAKIH